jgi:hypothetical protein
MVKALTIGVSVLAGILIGRIQTIENHAANDAIAASERAEKRATDSKREVIRTRTLLDHTERQMITMWRTLEPMLEDFTQADDRFERDEVRQRIQVLRWEMQRLDAVITAARETNGEDERALTRQAWLKSSR